MRRLLFRLAVFALPLGVWAQGAAEIKGRVIDGTKSVVPGARITAMRADTSAERTVVTNEAGLYHMPALVAGTYQLTVRREGFQTIVRDKVELRVGAKLQIDFQLQVGEVAQSITVESGPNVDSAPGVSAVVNSRQIMDLPINGRRVDSFVLLSPAVAPEGTSGLLTFRGIPGGNSFLTDGNDTTNQLWNENGGRARIASNVSQDAVQEFQVLSENFSAEFGRAIGGVVNTVTRSGSNNLHGTGFWFFRNQEFNARDRYSAVNPDEKRNQLGGSVGGAIIRDKLFYFANSEIMRRDFPLVSSMTRAPLFDASGNFVGACTASAAQCSAAIASTARFNRIIGRTASNNLGFAKLDYIASPHNTFSASFNLLNWSSPNGLQTVASSTTGAGVGSNGNSEVKTRFARLAWTSSPSATMVNEFRFGWFKDRLVDTLSGELLPPTGAAAVTVQGVSNFGASTSLPRVYPTEDRFQFADTLSLVRGKHAIKLGVDLSQVRDVQDQVFQGNGSYVYSTFTDYALDFSGNSSGARHWTSYTQAFGPPLVKTWVRDYTGFLQDEYRISPRLTANFGLRYEFSQFTQPATCNPDYPQTCRIPEPKSNFAPRISFVYAPFNEKTVIRAGYGIFYARTTGSFVNWLNRDNAVFQYTVSLQATSPTDLAAGPVFPNKLGSTNNRPPAGSVSMTFASDDWRTPYTQQADLSVERDLGSGMNLTASYLWSRGIAFTTGRDINVGAPTATATYTILDTAGKATGTFTMPGYLAANRVDSRYQRIGVLDSGGNTYYNALALRFQKRLGRWWQGSAAYTWSHAIDYNLGVTGDNLSYGSTPRSVANGDYRGEKGTSDLDQRQRFVFNSVFDLKFGLKGGWFLRNVVDGWQLAQVTTLARLPGVTPVVAVSGAPFTGAAFTGAMNGLGSTTRVPFLPRGWLAVDNAHQADIRFSKLFTFADRYSLQLMFDVFNLSNSQYNTSVQSQAYSASKGVLTPTARLGEGSASAGFPDGTNARRAQVGVRFSF